MKEIRGIWLPDTDQHLEHQLKMNPLVEGKGTYQWKKYDKAKRHVEKRGHALDIGAQVGLWSRVMALDFERVTSIEPLPAHHECFARNLIGHNNVTLLQMALDSEPGELKIAMPPETTGNSHVASRDELGVIVPAMRLDDLHLADIDFLKIDVEGYELPILEGGKQTILRDKPVIIIEQKPNGNAERYGRGRFAALNLLQQWGGKVRWEIGGDYLVEMR